MPNDECCQIYEFITARHKKNANLSEQVGILNIVINSYCAESFGNVAAGSAGVS